MYTELYGGRLVPLPLCANFLYDGVMQTNGIRISDFIIDVLGRLLEETERNRLGETKEVFWFSFYKMPRSEDTANRLNDQSVRKLVDLLKDDGAIDVIQLLEIDYRPSNVKYNKPAKLLDAVELRITDMSKLHKVHSGLQVAYSVLDQDKITARYDSDNRQLWLGDKVIKVSGSSRLPLFEGIFKSDRTMRRTWHNDELRKLKDPYPDNIGVPNDWGTTTADNFNQKKLKPEMGFSDFFIVKQGSVKVNPKYLS